MDDLSVCVCVCVYARACMGAYAHACVHVYIILTSYMGPCAWKKKERSGRNSQEERKREIK